MVLREVLPLSSILYQVESIYLAATSNERVPVCIVIELGILIRSSLSSTYSNAERARMIRSC